MPSPIAHLAAGYAIYRAFTAAKESPVQSEDRTEAGPQLLIGCIVFSMLPDLDFIPGLLFGGVYDEFHNTVTNSLVVGFLVAAVFSMAIWLRTRKRYLFWFTLVLSCYELHVIMDFFTMGRGAMLFWPFSAERFQPGIKLFYGLHRSDGWISIRHLWTLLTESAFALLVYLFADRLLPRRLKQ